MRRLIFLAAALALLAGPLTPSARAADESLEQVLVESATTPQQHAALANYYAAKATAARKDAEEHRAMAKSYGGGKATQLAAMKDHCDKLANPTTTRPRSSTRWPPRIATWPSSVAEPARLDRIPIRGIRSGR
jgi:hypothetical protein